MSILDAFNYYFEMVAVDSEELKQEVYKLRYQVYCLEKDFENPERHTDGLEYDEYDEHSCHYLIRHRATDSYMATTRLILPNRHPFPIEANSQIDTKLVKNINRANLAELSRFCVSKQFRRRANERDLIITNDTDESRTSPRGKHSSASITLALFACAVKISSEHNILYWIALIEPALKRVVAPLGINVTQIGPLVDYHGTRVPCVIKVADLLNSIAEKDIDYWAMVTNNGQILI
ncbi:MAG: PEP-CTERM/exosortase system-associated acyltransferase [Methylococcales bacterium]